MLNMNSSTNSPELAVIPARKPRYASDPEIWTTICEMTRPLPIQISKLKPDVIASFLVKQHDEKTTRLPKISETKQKIFSDYLSLTSLANDLVEGMKKSATVRQNKAAWAIINRGAAAKVLILAKGEEGLARLLQKGRIGPEAAANVLESEKKATLHLNIHPKSHKVRERSEQSIPQRVENLIPYLESSESDPAKQSVPYLKEYIKETKTDKPHDD